MRSILHKAFGRKKDEKDARSQARQSRSSLLDGKFERVSPTVSPSVENFPESSKKAENGKSGNYRLTLNLPSGAKEEAGPRELGTVFEADPGAYSLVPQSVINERRLSPPEALILLRACSQSIIAHGLETLGVMHPHWHSSSPEDQRRLISLFIHSLTLSPTPAAASFESEVGYVRSPHDVAAVLRWGLRHLQLDGAAPDFGKESAWYSKFVTGEREGDYSPKAFQDILTPLLPDAHRELLMTILDVISSIAAHSEANGISGSKLSKFIGLWLLTTQRASEGDDFASFYARWERMGRILEHLFLARIREESLRQQMPRRLTELVKRYPYSRQPESDLLPRPPFSTRLNDALYVRIETDIAPHVVPSKLHPLRVIAEALKADPPIDASEAHVALWERLRRTPSEDADTLSRIFADDTIRLFALVPADNDSEDATTYKLLLPTAARSGSLSTAPTSPITSPISAPSMSFAAGPSTAPTTAPASPAQASVALPTNGGAMSLDWAQFSTAGFLETKDIAPLAATLLDKDVEVTVPRAPGRRKVPKLTVQSKVASPTTSPPTSAPPPATPSIRAPAKTTQVFVRKLDEAFIDFWADGLTDPVAADWPSFVLCRLKETGADDVLPNVPWVVIEHAYKKIEPPAPTMEESAELGNLARTASPRPSLASDMGSRKRFSLFKRSSTKRSASKAGRIGELGEIMSDGEEDLKEEQEKKEQEKKEKAKDPKEKKEKSALKFVGIKRKSVDLRGSSDVPRASKDVPRKSSEVLPKSERMTPEKMERMTPEKENAEEGNKIAQGATAVAAGAVAGGAAVAVADAVASEPQEAEHAKEAVVRDVAEPGADAPTEAPVLSTEAATEPVTSHDAPVSAVAEPEIEPAAAVDESVVDGPAVPVEDSVSPSAVEPSTSPAEISDAPNAPAVTSEPVIAVAPLVEETSVVEEAPAVEEAAPVVEEVPPTADEVLPASEEVAPEVEEEAPIMAEVAEAVEPVTPVVEEEVPTAEVEADPAVDVASAEDVSEAPLEEEEPTPSVQETSAVADEPVEAPPVVEEEVPSPPAEEPVAVEHDVEDPAVEAPVEDVVPAAVEAEAPSDDATPAVQESVVDEEEPAPETTRDVATEVPDLEEPVPAVDVAPAEESPSSEVAPTEAADEVPEIVEQDTITNDEHVDDAVNVDVDATSSADHMPVQSGAEDAEVPVIADDGTSEPAVAAEDEAVVESTQSSPDAGDDLVDLPSVPIVSSEPVLPANAPAVPDVSDLPATPSIDVPASSDDAVPEEAADMPPAPESVVVSGSTPGPTLAFSTSEPVAAVEAAKDKETEESGN
ncbi:hypothetical protein BD626DRAFT_503341 [Schizophyllum amplum]|uniref:Rho-GAP domain-containing protein n=1 Tax=Schizophyllum amplum TaxID=97359 RepID=A0A550C841_9AGAR|nr:hypothetical protein BD626DRAFT_503341 [Auriculariopsis ampla]